MYDEYAMAGIPSSILLEARTNHGYIIPIPAGYRKPSKTLELWEPIGQLLPRIDSRLRVNKHTDLIGCCVWLSACLLVNVLDKTTATKMHEYMKTNMDKCKFLYLFTGKKKNHLGRNTLGTQIQPFKYQLQHVTETKQQTRLEFLMSTTAIGMYICLLSDQQLGGTHAIGIDCRSEKKIIWDCCESCALELSRENLDKCCGDHNVFANMRSISELKFYDGGRGDRGGKVKSLT